LLDLDLDLDLDLSGGVDEGGKKGRRGWWVWW
jgi:hypothetical protein